MSPAQAILRGYNKDYVFKQQQTFKKRNGLKDDGSAKYGFGGDIKVFGILLEVIEVLLIILLH